VDLSTVVVTTSGVRDGMPCFAGPRITVEDVLDYLASGMTIAQIVGDFPELTNELVNAAVEFESVRERRTPPIEFFDDLG
jgi:uncharacterized protein (DUF433 family)